MHTANLNAADQFGYSVATIGDLDTDGINDLAVGAVLDLPQINSGGVFILFMASDGGVNSFRKITGGNTEFTATLNPSEYFGRSIAGLGDLNNDGNCCMSAQHNK